MKKIHKREVEIQWKILFGLIQKKEAIYKLLEVSTAAALSKTHKPQVFKWFIVFHLVHGLGLPLECT